MQVRIKLLHPLAVIPVQRDGDSGADLHALHAEVVYPWQTAKVNFGLALEIPEGYEAQVRPRSGLSSKGFVVVLGTVDAGYRGELGATLTNTTRDQAWVIRPGDRVAQLVIAPVARVTYEPSSELSETQRGAAGWGSSGVGR